MAECFVSVVVPVYKTAPYLRQCLNSILASKLHEIEVICVDDGSPDDSGKILDDYAKRDKRVHVIHQKNRGAGAAYYVGQKLAKGEYVGFIDSDDWVEPGMFYDLYQAAQKTNADVVKAGACFIETLTGSNYSIKIPAQKCNRLITNLLEVPEFVNRHVSHWSAIYKRKFLEDNHISTPEDKRESASDIPFVYDVWIHAKSLYVVPSAYVHYRQTNPNSDTKQGSRMSFYLIEGHIEASRRLLKFQRTSSAQWAIKTRVEYEHFLFEWNYRCLGQRLKFACAIARIFKQNIQKGFVNPNSFNSHEWRVYRFIACMPFVFWLNDTVRFWNSRSNMIQKSTTFYRLFGLFKIVQTPYYKKYYVLGIPYWSERLYDAEFAQLRETNMMLRQELNLIKNQLKVMKK